jgi:hypothetical protein
MGYRTSIKLLSPGPRFVLGSRWLLRNSIALIIQLVIIFAVMTLLPCVIDVAGFALSLLAIQVEVAENNVRCYVVQKYNNLFLEFHGARGKPCSKQFSTPTKVYLTASELSLSNDSSNSSTKSGSLADHMTRDIPLVELVQLFPRSNHAELYRMHWTVVIRGMVYELLRAKGSRKVVLRATPFSSYTEADALGLPLTLAWVEEIGTTYLSDQSILCLGRWLFLLTPYLYAHYPRTAQKAMTRKQHYDPFLHSCQTI